MSVEINLSNLYFLALSPTSGVTVQPQAPRSHQPAPHVLVTLGGALPPPSGSPGDSPDPNSDPAYQCIRFQPFQQSSWHQLCDQALKQLWVIFQFFFFY